MMMMTTMTTYSKISEWECKMIWEKATQKNPLSQLYISETGLRMMIIFQGQSEIASRLTQLNSSSFSLSNIVNYLYRRKKKRKKESGVSHPQVHDYSSEVHARLFQ